MLVTQPPHHFCEIITVSETCIAGNFVIPFSQNSAKIPRHFELHAYVKVENDTNGTDSTTILADTGVSALL